MKYFLLPIICLCASIVNAAELKDSDIAALVNGESITVGTVNDEIRRQPALSYEKMQAKDDQKKLRALQIASLNAIIERKLLLEAAKKSGTIDDTQIKKEVDEELKAYESKEQLTEMLKQIGTTYDRFVNDVSDNHRIRAYLDKQIPKDIKVSDTDIKAEYDKDPSKYAERDSVHARHILVKVEDNATEAQWSEAEAKIKKIRSEVAAPKADFAAIAKLQSDCPSKERGGDLGFFQSGMMVPEFEKAAFSLKPGEISEPVRTKFGYHLIKLEEKKAGKAADFTTAKPKLERQLVAKKRFEAVKEVITKLRQEAKIEIKISDIA